MLLQPPPAFVELMERLGVADLAQIHRAGRAIRRHVRELQSFEAVWIDALVRAKKLTPFQAREIHAGRGQELKIGPYLLCEKLRGPPYVSSYRAKWRDSGEIVRLAVDCRTSLQPVDLSLQTNPNDERNQQAENLYPLRPAKNLPYNSGIEGNRRFFAWPWLEGRTVAQGLMASGRFSAEMVLEIARAMVAELASLQKAGGCHGDVAPWNVLLTSSGETVLLHAGLRAVVRPEEGFAFAELLPEAYDYLAPERVISGTPPDMAGDMYSCGCVWWQLLCGRPPLAGGDSLAKLRAVQNAETSDVRRLAPETPAVLAEAISACLQKEPNRRPTSWAKLAAMLRPASKGSRQFLARTMASYRGSNPLDINQRRKSHARNWPVWLAAVIGCVSVILMLLGPTFHAWWEKANSAKTIARQRGEERKTATARKQIGNLPRGRIDREVKPVVYSAEAKTKKPRQSVTDDYLLETNAPQNIEALSLQRGQRVIGRSGRRATILVSASGLKLEGEEIRLENLDFIWNAAHKPGKRAAMIHFAGSRADFRGCRFFAAKGVSDRPAVLCWTDGKNVDTNLALQSGRMQFAHCIFHHAGESINCRRRGAIALEAKNCFLFETEGFLRLDHQPELDETIALDLAGCTMRSTGPLLLCRQMTSKSPPGEVAIQSESCVFALRKGEPLLAFEGVDPPDAALRKMLWNGAGSLVAVETPVGAWKSATNPWEPLDDTNLAIAGLVRSRLEFAEKAENPENPAVSSQLLQWQAPLPTLEPPGVDEETLPKVEKEG